FRPARRPVVVLHETVAGPSGRAGHPRLGAAGSRRLSAHSPGGPCAHADDPRSERVERRGIGWGWEPAMVRADRPGHHSCLVDGVFIAGDASGHCLPLTGEGIRTAVLAGFECGDLLRQVLDGERTRDQAEATYQAFVAKSRRKFHALTWANLAVLALPRRAVASVATMLARPRVLRPLLAQYLNLFERSATRAGATLPAHSGRL